LAEVVVQKVAVEKVAVEAVVGLESSRSSRSVSDIRVERCLLE
jgi:hypothetical protein